MQTGNTPWAVRYAADLREVVLRYAARLPRNTQRHLGPSELGHHCDRQLVGKMAGVEFQHGGNRLHDSWPSIVGTALHAFMEEAFAWDAANSESPNFGRWFTECRVTPDPGSPSPHPGTADLFDVMYASLDDHKMQSEAVRANLRRHGLPYHYYIQLLLYALGYMHKGYNVQRIVLVSWPRTKSDLNDMYVHEKLITAEDLAEVFAVLDKTLVREALAKFVVSGEMSFWDVPPTPSDDDCRYCPFWNPAAMQDKTAQGCPGTSLKKV